MFFVKIPNLAQLKSFKFILNSAKMYDIVEDGGHWKLVNDDGFGDMLKLD